MAKKYDSSLLTGTYEEGQEIMPEIPNPTCSVVLGKSFEVIKTCTGSDQNFSYVSTVVTDGSSEKGSGTVTDANGEVDSYEWGRKDRQCQTTWERSWYGRRHNSWRVTYFLDICELKELDFEVEITHGDGRLYVESYHRTQEVTEYVMKWVEIDGSWTQY